jgi:hypothetical protein
MEKLRMANPNDCEDSMTSLRVPPEVEKAILRIGEATRGVIAKHIALDFLQALESGTMMQRSLQELRRLAKDCDYVRTTDVQDAVAEFERVKVLPLIG